MKNLICLTGIALLAGSVASAQGQRPKPETVVGGLNNPCGIAIQPETGHVFRFVQRRIENCPSG